MSSRPLRLALLVASLGAFGAGLVPGCYGRQESDEPPPDTAACTGCHGDPNRKGDKLHNAAPPRDLLGNTAVGYPGVGAHQNHLNASETHLAIACNECHKVPHAVRDPGHADDRADAGNKGKAEINFGTCGLLQDNCKDDADCCGHTCTSGKCSTDGTALATAASHNPSFDYATLKCSDTYCHRDSNPLWLQPRNSVDACGSCHGIPPALPHPQVEKTQCVRCHAATIDSSGNIKDPTMHVNGKVDLVDAGCATCHGNPDEPDPLKRGAPPTDVSGNSETTFEGVGAHQVHVMGLGNGRAVACGECHTVPEKVDSPGHADTPLPAEVNITGVATSNGHSPTWNHDTQKCSNTWCHGPDVTKDSPVWTSGSGTPLKCDTCHGQPPAWPHVQMTECSRCHGDVVAADNVTIKDKSLHANGVVNVTPKTACTDCHGTAGAANPAPPVDIGGNTATTSAGVGAHQSHLVGTGASPWHRAVQCDDCHVVPNVWTDVGHIDTFLPAELTFGALAKVNGTTPSYAAGKCDNVYCHGAKFKSNIPGGPITSPEWTKVDGTQAECGKSCHTMPPAAPHPPSGPTGCFQCHGDVVDFNLKFVNPDKHIDGKSFLDPP
jgi:predicted CxxxxCH...CXXCH cytochrome family protein